jgi:hypothetical protein
MDWHGEYDRPGSRLNQRLAAVQAQIAGALDRAAPGPVRVVSMCAGQAGVRMFTFVDELP